MAEEGRVISHHHESNTPPPPSSPEPPIVTPQDYGTFEGGPTFAPSDRGFPQPAPPSMGFPQPGQHRGYQSVPGYAVAETPPRDHLYDHHRLPCCGIGYGWFLFIIGFFLAGVPWYAGAIIFICCRNNFDPREKLGYGLCTIASVLGVIVTVMGVHHQLND